MTHLDDSRLVRSAHTIGIALGGISAKTVQRMVRKGVLQARKFNGPTSPLVATRAEIERLRRGEMRED